MNNYSDFLQHKLAIAPKRGLDVSDLTQPSYLKHHQSLAVKWAAGLGTVPFLAVKMKRRAFACELNSVYFDASVRYLAQAEIERKTPTLFEWALQAGAAEQIEDEILEQQTAILESAEEF